jgi:hypothetical protein
MTGRASLVAKYGAPIAAALMLAGLAGTAQAQSILHYSQTEPLYPYVTQPQYDYPRQQYAPAHSHVRPHAKPAPRTESKVDPELVKELRKGSHKKQLVSKRDVAIEKKIDKDIEKKIEKKFDKKIIVREKPIVRKHYRVIDDPPIVVQREIDESQLPLRQDNHIQQPAGNRTIHAEAEVTILGPDRMSIRLYRKQDGRDANAKAPASKSKKLKTSKSANSEPQT